MSLPLPKVLDYKFLFQADKFRRECCFRVSDAQQGCGGQEFYNRYERIGTTFCRHLRPELADLVEVATALYCADRFALRRHPDRHGTSRPLPRRLHLRLGVRRPGVWRGRAAQLLEDLLWQLCGDIWTLEFTSFYERPRPTAVQSYLPDLTLSKPAKVLLFSGGLDSFAGAAVQMEDQAHTHVLVSGYTHPQMCADQARQTEVLLAGRRAHGHHVAVPYGLIDRPKLRLEPSQRSRVILHASLGAITALHLGADTLHIYENGVGALGLPFDETQSGWEVSAAMRPQTLRLLERLITEVSGQSFRIETPSFFLTKAQALTHPAVHRLAAGIRDTFSCDRYPDHYEGHRQCGACPACVLRRMALETAGLAAHDPVDGYAFDLGASEAVPPQRAAFVLDKIDGQAESFSRAIANRDPWRALVRHWSELCGAETALAGADVPSAEVRPRLLDLLARHVDEWQGFSGRHALGRYLAN